MQVFLIRHPRPFLDLGVCYGRLDIQAEDPQPVAARLKPLLPEGTTVFSSPLRRARLLAEALDPETRIDARLSEMDFGEWEGQPWNAIDRYALDAWAADILHYAPPGGESVAGLQHRAIDFVTGLRGSPVALVTHCGVIRALLGHWRQLSVDEWTSLQIDFGSMLEIEIDQ